MTSSTKALRIVFAGTPVFAAHHLQALIDSPHQLVAVYTQPDRRAGRGKKFSPSPVKTLADAHQLPVYQPVSLKDATVQAQLAAHNADIMVVVAYGLILPKTVLDIPRYGCFNVHGSLLPRWRGAAPIQRAIAAGDTVSGVTIMQMDAGLDTGDMLLKASCEISPQETSASLHDKLMRLGSGALLEVLSLLQQQQLNPEKQDDESASYAEKISKAEAAINWFEPAVLIERRIRTYNPVPIAYSFLKEQRIKIHQATLRATETSVIPVAGGPEAITPGTIIALEEDALVVACGQQALAIEQLQLPGKKPMAARQLLNGYSDLLQQGQCFGR